MDSGVIYVVYGGKVRQVAAKSVASLKKYNPNLHITVIGDHVLGADNYIDFDKPGKGARWAKLNLDKLTPYRYTLYIDADTRVKGDLSIFFDVLRDGWDLVMAPSGRQGRDVLGHLSGEDRQYTIDYLGYVPLNLQAGVFSFRFECGIMLFKYWREHWKKFGDQDQGALLRGLRDNRILIWILGGCWNSAGGEVVDHLFGSLK